jgi:hypothetical protein
MRTYLSQPHHVILALLCLVAAALLALSVAASFGSAPGGAPRSSNEAFAGRGSLSPAAGPAQQVIANYLRTLDADMQSGTFANLSQIYTSNASVIVTGGPLGSPPTILTGLGPITHFFESLRANMGPAQWTQDSGQQLAASVYVSYEQVSVPAAAVLEGCLKEFPKAPPGLCRYEADQSVQAASGPAAGSSVNAFTISGDQVASLDWLVYA